MSSEPDYVGAVFFAICGVLMICLTRWPRLWIAMSINRRWAVEEFKRKRKILPIMTALAALLCAFAVAQSLLG
ncbi:hypothetical protein [Brevundimonas sp.]|uniref:hypothetical protein n=1 Tax=Brevundimonas sp. TaxID=1871086 RepID=UPI001A300D4A|nr:hypothetical protein [Brevundimonas sp.]MBJ7485472.1 hypothetical protein [Brevundimonas sp.]